MPRAMRPLPRPGSSLVLTMLVTVLAGLCGVHQAPAQPGTAAEGNRIAGKVVNADSGAPLANAAVAIVRVIDGMRPAPDQDAPPRGRRGGRRAPASDALQSATTAEDGSFSFKHVPAGKYSLEASRRGFNTASYQEHGFYSTAIVTGVGIPSEGLLLKLSSGAVIAGSVIDTAGDPLEQARISLYRLSDDGLGSIRQFRGTSADDLGAYEFAHLPAGTYFLSATARVWYAQSARQQTSPEPAPSVATQNLDLVYPRTYYADASDSASATPIPIRGGEHLRADLHLQPVPSVHLSYTSALPGTESSPGGFHSFARPPMLFQPVFGERDATSTAVSTTYNQGQQTMQISVAPGAYEAEVAGRTLSINAGGDVLLDPQAGAFPIDISGKIASAPGAALAPDDVTMQLLDAHTTGAFTAPVHDGNFRFEGVRPGAYELSAQQGGRPLTVVEMAANGAPFKGHVLEVGTQPITLAATLAPASAMLSGFARSASTPPAASGQVDQAASGAMIVLVPEHPGDWGLYRRDQADSDGSFTLREVAAGKYTLVAIADGWDLEWAKPEVIAHYLPGGQPVSVPTTAAGTIRMSKPVIVQAR